MSDTLLASSAKLTLVAVGLLPLPPPQPANAIDNNAAVQRAALLINTSLLDCRGLCRQCGFAQCSLEQASLRLLAFVMTEAGSGRLMGAGLPQVKKGRGLSRDDVSMDIRTLAYRSRCEMELAFASAA